MQTCRFCGRTDFKNKKARDTHEGIVHKNTLNEFKVTDKDLKELDGKQSSKVRS